MPFGLRTTLVNKKPTEISLVDFLSHVQIEDVDLNGQSNGLIPFEPWPYLVDRAAAWEQGDSETILKGRQLGFTWLAAIYAVWLMRQKRVRILYIADHKLKASAFLDRINVIIDNLPSDLRPKVLRRSQTLIRFQTGSEIYALASSPRASRGFTGSVVIFDEAASQDDAAANFRGIRATVADGGQFLCMSTSAGPNGWFYERYMQQKERNAWEPKDNPSEWMTSKSTVFVPWFGRPDRDSEWYERERQEYTGEIDFEAENPATEEDAFRPPQGLVFPEFDRAIHTGKEPPVAFENCLWRVAGVDFGGDDPTAVVVMGVALVSGEAHKANHGYKLIQYAELYKRGGVPASEVKEFLAPWHQKASFFRVAVGERPKSPEIAELRKLGLPAVGMKGDPIARNRLHKMFLRNNYVWISQDCPNSIKEYASYRVKERTDPNTREKYVSGAVDHHADAIDARGMAMQVLWSAIRASSGGAKVKLNWHRSR